MTAKLTPQQQKALRLASEGVRQIEMGDAMGGMRFRTVMGYLRDARMRLDAVNTTHAVAIAIREGLI